MGDELAGVSVRWLVLERLSYSVNTVQGEGNEWRMMAEAAARFQRLARDIGPQFAFNEDLDTIRAFLHRAAEARCPGDVEALLARAQVHWQLVTQTCPREVCFGDLHFGNSLARTPPLGPGQVVLVDPIPRVQPWVFDAAYCQTIGTDRDVRLATLLAEARQRLGLPTPSGADFEVATTILLGWTAELWWGIAAWRHESPEWVKQTVRYINQAAVV